MRLSTRGQYGVRAMLELALNYGQGPLPVKAISKRQGVSVAYLEQLLTKLRREGLIESVRGPGGGYILSKAPSETSIGEIIWVLEGPIALADCLLYPSPMECERMDNCLSRLLWKKLQEKIEEVLNETSLQDLCNQEIGIVDKGWRRKSMGIAPLLNPKNHGGDRG